ncbi:MAG: ABC transporter substrate-binding protein [Desulfobacter postgatei]|uniref:ABC transporter substrate-binding protein n=1 Tax=Desulfobacter postgatei TaxID=2293 RepID=A0A2G6MRP0_9BACT|nr:MAG: ABC transporter substrate-binding protein [Desulfobacter postgatei]
MVKYVWFCCLSLLLFFGIAVAETSDNGVTEQPVLHFAPLPMENREAVYKQFEPLRVYLENITGRKVVFKYFDNYDCLLDNFISGGIDLAYLGPLPYVELRGKYPDAEPLVTFREISGKSGYTCSLITLPENQLQLSAIKGKRVALTQPLSTCGYLSVNGLLEKYGSHLEKNRYCYLGRHDAVALAIVRSEFDIGGVKTEIAHKYEHLGLKILEETDIFPGFALVSNSTSVDPETAETIRKSFDALQPDGKDREMLSAWGNKLANGAVPATDKQYDIIRRLLGDVVIPKKDNCR